MAKPKFAKGMKKTPNGGCSSGVNEDRLSGQYSSKSKGGQK